MSLASLDELVTLLRGRRVCLLSGAGLSTESGIPDYRGPQTKLKPRNPMQHQTFIGDAQARRRYWARALLGWSRFRDVAPNAGHVAVAELQAAGVVTGLITQNVDRLHHRAGSADVVELHGSLHEVRCMVCSALESREVFQARLLGLNPHAAGWTAQVAPDGDADLDDAALDGFQVPSCTACEGFVKPDVVFFGDHVPAPRVEAAFARLRAAEALLVVGSSLAVYSGYRFVLRAVEWELPVALINLGESRADSHARVRIEAPAGETLTALSKGLRS